MSRAAASKSETFGRATCQFENSPVSAIDAHLAAMGQPPKSPVVVCSESLPSDADGERIFRFSVYAPRKLRQRTKRHQTSRFRMIWNLEETSTKPGNAGEKVRHRAETHSRRFTRSKR